MARKVQIREYGPIHLAKMDLCSNRLQTWSPVQGLLKVHSLQHQGPELNGPRRP